MLFIVLFQVPFLLLQVCSFFPFFFDEDKYEIFMHICLLSYHLLIYISPQNLNFFLCTLKT